MFVNIVRTSDDGKSQHHTALYECSRFHIHPVEGKATEFTITMKGLSGADNVSVTYDTKEPGLGIYVMNHFGRTIDTIFRSAM